MSEKKVYVYIAVFTCAFFRRQRDATQRRFDILYYSNFADMLCRDMMMLFNPFARRVTYIHTTTTSISDSWNMALAELSLL